MGRFIRFFTGVLIGAFVGGLMAVLLTPSSGKILRNRIAENAAHLKDEVRLAALEKRTELEKELGDMRQHIVIN
jgi:gas vesicle protein